MLGPLKLTPTQSKKTPQTPGPWLRRKGQVRSRERDQGKGLRAEAARWEGEKRQRLAEGSAEAPQALQCEGSGAWSAGPAVGEGEGEGWG